MFLGLHEIFFLILNWILVLKNFNSLQIFYSCRGQGEEMEFTDTAARKSVSCDMNFGIRANNVLLGFLRIIYAKIFSLKS